ncbi:MAG: AAA family ATPase [Candidatus Aminicenantes bacterium]|nr:AAA family ATPase [Candidatus Aminicenantes bacterium]
MRKKNLFILLDLVPYLLVSIMGFYISFTYALIKDPPISLKSSLGIFSLFFVIFVFFISALFLFSSSKKRLLRLKGYILEDLGKTTLGEKLKQYQELLNNEPENAEVLSSLARIYEKLGEKEKALEFYERLAKIAGENEFEFNLSKTIILQRLELRDLYFFDDFSWDFQPRMNVLLGKNGYGKSHLLRLLVFLVQKEEAISSDFFKQNGGNPLAKLEISLNSENRIISRGMSVFEKTPGKLPVLAIPALRYVDKAKTNIGVPNVEKADLKFHGADRFLYQESVEGMIQNFLYQLCVTYLDKGKSFDLPVFNLIHKVIGELTDSGFTFDKINPLGTARFRIEVITEGNQAPLPLQQASQGTLSVLAIFGLIYEYLKAIFPDIPEKELLFQPAIVFIDELDAHLHPSWQQKIIRLLRENFPNIQFFVTAHSPLVVAGCKEGEVAVLRKGENGFRVEVSEQDFIGTEAKELYERVFEIEESDEPYLRYLAMAPFKGEMEEKIKELENKRKKKPLSKKEEDELSRLYDDVFYIGKVSDKYRRRMEYSLAPIENRKLKNKIKELEKKEGPKGA